MRGRRPPAPDTFLPLSPAVLAILVVLDGAPRHGYAIAQAVREESGGALRLDTGPLYRHLRRLLDDGLVEEVDAPERDDDERRRYYRPTSLGRLVLAAETARLEALLGRPRRRATAPRG
ncbi:MAG TPA: PadR family transcriptional regulator [Vicinamibacterales bacterium]|nr:PadR family transcriptional regulator [Vicinamibacterales bacterium]